MIVKDVKATLQFDDGFMHVIERNGRLATYCADKSISSPIHGRGILDRELNSNQFIDVGFGFRRTKDIKIVTVTEEERDIPEPE